MKRVKPDGIEEVIEHCRDKGGKARHCGWTIAWDCQKGALVYDRTPTEILEVNDYLLNMDNWLLLIEDEPEVQEWPRVEEATTWFSMPTEYEIHCQIHFAGKTTLMRGKTFVCTGFRHEGSDFKKPQAIMWHGNNDVFYTCKPERFEGERSLATHAIMEEVSDGT